MGIPDLCKPLALGQRMQILGACIAYHVWDLSFILVTKFYAKIIMVGMLYKTCGWIFVRNNNVFAGDVVEYIKRIIAKSNCIHFIHLLKKNTS